MANNFPPNLNPAVFSLSAVAIAMLLVDGFDANEQNSIANWLLLIGQYMATNAAQQQLIDSRQQENNTTSSNEHNQDSDSSKNNNDNHSNDKNNNEDDETSKIAELKKNRQDIDYLLEAVQLMQQELEKLRKVY